MNGNPNHPQKGAAIKAEPIKSLGDIERVRSLLKGSPRDLALFNVGINSTLRAKDLVNLKVGDVRSLKPGMDLKIRESKTGKTRSIPINQVCYESIQSLLNSPRMRGAGNESFLFRSRKGGKELLPNSLNYLIKRWAKQAGLEGNYGGHTLRKTYGHIHLTVFNVGILTLQKMFGHCSQKQTLDYLCLLSFEDPATFMKEI